MWPQESPELIQKPWSFYWPNMIYGSGFEYALYQVIPRIFNWNMMMSWFLSPQGAMDTLTCWEERIKTPKREKKWERNKSQRPQIWAFPARSGTDNHLILYIKAKTHWKGTSVHRDQHPAGYMRQNRPPPTHTWAQQPSRGCQMVLTSTWKRRGWHLWRMLQKLTPENHPPNNRLIPSRRVSEARKFASRWDWAILGCLMRSGKAEASRVRGKLADECSDGEREVRNFVSGLFHWTETRFRPFFPQKNSTSIPQSYTHTHTQMWQMEKENT